MVSILTEKNEIKIFILYLMRQINYPLPFSTLNDITVQDGALNYFEFADCFADLLETGNVEEIELDGKDLYVISEQGIRVADTLMDTIPKAMREKSLKSALRLLSFQKRGAKVKCYVEESEARHFFVYAAITEGGEELFHVRLQAADQLSAEKMRDYFLEKPEAVYRGLLTVFTGDVDYLVK